MTNKQHFVESGYRVFKNVVHLHEMEYLLKTYDDILDNKYDLDGYSEYL